MYTNFSLNARRAVGSARMEVSNLGRPAVDPEDLLVGLLLSRGLGARALRALGLTADELRERIGYDFDVIPTKSYAQLAEIGLKAGGILRQSATQAHILGKDYVGTEHIAVAIAGYDSGLVGDILKDHGISDMVMLQQIEEFRFLRSA